MHCVFCITKNRKVTNNLPAGGGYVISPINRGKQSVVKHMLAIDWKFWKSYLQTSSARSITIHMLGRIAGVLLSVFVYKATSAFIYMFHFLFHKPFWHLFGVYTFVIVALRELFRAKLGDYPSADLSSDEMVKDGELSQHDKCLTIEAQRKDSMTTEECMEEVVKTPSDHANLVGLNDAADEFFDVSEPLDYDPSEDGWPTDPEAYAQVL